MIISFFAFFLTLNSQRAAGLLAPQPKTGALSHVVKPPIVRFTRLDAVQQESQERTFDVTDEATKLRDQARKMRLEAEKMDLSLTLGKIKSLEEKLQNKRWLGKYPDKESELRAELVRLNNRLNKEDEGETETTTFVQTRKEESAPTPIRSPVRTETTRKSLDAQGSKSKPRELPIPPIAGFDDTDLRLYVPVANDINKMMTNGTIEEKLEAFRTAPELQEHFQKKIQSMLVGPLEEMQRLENLKSEYLDSSSTVEKENLKREIERLENDMEEDGPFMYSDSFYCEDLEPLTEEALSVRMQAMNELPDILQAIYKQRNGLQFEDPNLQLAIEMDYYEPQTQLLEQARFVDPLPDEKREAFRKGYNALPQSVQEQFCSNMGLEARVEAEKLLEKLLEDDSPMSTIMEVVQASSASGELAEYNDIDFIDRSRYLEEFYPAIGRMEEEHPAKADVELFTMEVLNKKSFMVTSKPERVAGGYYIRGTNLLSDDEDGSLTAADKLVAQVSESLQKSELAEKLEFFYILDPSPLTDEEMEFGPTEKPIFVVTTKNAKKFYSSANPITKSVVTLSGLMSTLFFSIGACALNPAISDRFTATLDTASSTGVLDLQWLSDLVVPIILGTLMIQILHELAHRLVAMNYKVCRAVPDPSLGGNFANLVFTQFDVGVPNVIPSVTTGFAGVITPLKSPPPNLKSLFDFSIAGPLVGLTASLILLLSGLEMTSSMDIGTPLPVLPVDVLRASSLGGGMVQFFLGNGAVMQGQGPAAVVELHPLAIAGFMGCLTNSLALLPLGRK